MGLRENITENMKTALKESHKLKLMTLRGLFSEIRNVEIAKKQELNEDEIIEVVCREIKRRKEAICEFEKANRQDLVEKESSELHILEEYLPPQLSGDEIKQIVAQAIEKSKAASLKEMGKVMSLIMPQIKGKADGRLVSEIVKSMLEAKA